MLDLNITEPLFTDELTLDNNVPRFQHKSVPPAQQVSLTLPESTIVKFRFAVRRDEYLLPLIFNLSQHTRQVDTLEIDRGLSDTGHSAYEQGWDKEAPLLMGKYLISNLSDRTCFSVRSLVIISIGKNAKFVMSLLDTSTLRELVVNRCMHVEFILNPLVQNAMLLTSVAIVFGDRHADTVEGPVRYHQLKTQDKRYALDFVRAGNFTLTDLQLFGDFADSRRDPKSLTLLVPELWFAIQAHMSTLVRLSILNDPVDFTVSRIEELGRCAPHLQELRISARMGVPNLDAPSHLTEGLAVSDLFHLHACNVHSSSWHIVLSQACTSCIPHTQDSAGFCHH